MTFYYLDMHIFCISDHKIYISDHKSLFNDLKKILKGEKEDNGGVNGSHNDLLPGPIWNYNSIVEKPSRTNN